VTDSEPTLTTPILSVGADSAPLLGLTILWHPNQQRIGQQFMGPGAEGVIELQRFLPLFRHPGEDGMALGHRCIARHPLAIRRAADDWVTVIPPDSRMTVEVNGSLITSPACLPPEAVGAGIVLGLGGLVLICVHWISCLPKPNKLPGLQGVSSAIVTVREQIGQVARTSLPVLLLGETGSGKDVAALEIHRASERHQRPFIAVNMAALNESLAAADLFGALKGAYTGAEATRTGFFAEADDGTLFLDEIGDTPGPVQAMLLRVLESGEFRPLGAQRTQRSRARLIAATDRDLAERGFSQALLRRIEAFVIRMPALRERREDIGLLLRHLLQEWSAQSGRTVELPVCFVSEMCNDNWPGNIRQLVHVLRRAVIEVSAGVTPVLAAFARVEPNRHHEAHDSAAASSVTAPPPQAERRRRSVLADLSHEDVLDAMGNNEWQIKGAAQQLGISRPSLYKLLNAHPTIRSPELIPSPEIQRALERHRGDLKRCAASLNTPYEQLRRQVRALGLDN